MDTARKDNIICNMSKYFYNINSHNASCKTQLPWQLKDSDKSVVVLEDMSSWDNKGKTSIKKTDNTKNPVVENNMMKLENQLNDVRNKIQWPYCKDHFLKRKYISINNINPKD